MNTNRILIVDDEEDICEILKFNLQDENTEITTVNSGEEVLNLDINKFDIILLDVMMGGISGFKLADKIRQEYKSDIPIIFITAKDAENDMLTGFNLGGDDYISKPFSVKEVSARVKAILKRKPHNKEQKVEHIKFDTIDINTTNKTVKIDDEQIKLTKKEFEILQLLITREGKVLSRDEILEHVWKDDSFVVSRTVDVHITRLRKKLGNYGTFIRNRSGFGYCFSSEE